MISRKNFDIQTVLFRNWRSCKRVPLWRSSQFFSAQDLVHGFVTSPRNGIFHFLELLKFSSMWNIIWTIIFDLAFMTSPKNFEIRTALLRRPTTFLQTVGLPVWQSSQFFSAQDSVHGFVTRVSDGIFSFPLITEILINVEHYLENNIWFILHDYAKNFEIRTVLLRNWRSWKPYLSDDHCSFHKFSSWLCNYSLSPGVWQSFVTIRSCNHLMRIISTYLDNTKKTEISWRWQLFKLGDNQLWGV